MSTKKINVLVILASYIDNQDFIWLENQLSEKYKSRLGEVSKILQYCPNALVLRTLKENNAEIVVLYTDKDRAVELAEVIHQEFPSVRFLVPISQRVINTNLAAEFPPCTKVFSYQSVKVFDLPDSLD